MCFLGAPSWFSTVNTRQPQDGDRQQCGMGFPSKARVFFRAIAPRFEECSGTGTEMSLGLLSATFRSGGARAGHKL